MIRGIIPTDGSPARVDMSVGDQLRERAAMGGERERAEFAAFEGAAVELHRGRACPAIAKEAEAHGVDVVMWLKRDKSTAE